MTTEGTLLLQRSAVHETLDLRDCIEAVERVFRAYGEGEVTPPRVLGIKTDKGGLHVKAAVMPGPQNYIVAKLNTNFPGNRAAGDLPTIQGVVVVCHGNDGRILAVLDSIDLTVKRTAAASAVAAKYLARPESAVVTICGCGQQGRAQLRALKAVLPLRKIFAFDVDGAASAALAKEVGAELGVEAEAVADFRTGLRESDACITCTPSTKFFIAQDDIRPGTFIAAVGADDAHKQEIDPELMASAKVVADHLEQSCTIGDTHHAIAAGLMRKEDVHAELADIVSGHRPGRANATEITIFDSTGVAIEDAVAAVAVYEKARHGKAGSRFNFGG
jgi:ornithine cyclodeaminase/alanine dehydrogenase-like protein (mu-crystallin family)